MNEGTSGNTSGMPDRAIIPLMPAVSLGFICGLVVSVLQLQDGPTLIVALAGAAAVAIAGTSSVFGVRGETGEKAAVAALRSLCAIAVFGCLFLFMTSFLRDGSILTALIWLPLAGVFALLLTRLSVRERKPVEGREDDDAEDADGREREDENERDTDTDTDDAKRSEVNHVSAQQAERDGRIYRESDDFAEAPDRSTA